MRLTRLVPITILADGIWCDPDCPYYEKEDGLCILEPPNSVGNHERLSHLEYRQVNPNIPGRPKKEYECMGLEKWIKETPTVRFQINPCSLTYEGRVRTRYCWDYLGDTENQGEEIQGIPNA